MSGWCSWWFQCWKAGDSTASIKSAQNGPSSLLSPEGSSKRHVKSEAAVTVLADTASGAPESRLQGQARIAGTAQLSLGPPNQGSSGSQEVEAPLDKGLQAAHPVSCAGVACVLMSQRFTQQNPVAPGGWPAWPRRAVSCRGVHSRSRIGPLPYAVPSWPSQDALSAAATAAVAAAAAFTQLHSLQPLHGELTQLTWLGSGTGGRVYSGLWRGTPVAVKIIVSRTADEVGGRLGAFETLAASPRTSQSADWALSCRHLVTAVPHAVRRNLGRCARACGRRSWGGWPRTRIRCSASPRSRATSRSKTSRRGAFGATACGARALGTRIAGALLKPAGGVAPFTSAAPHVSPLPPAACSPQTFQGLGAD